MIRFYFKYDVFWQILLIFSDLMEFFYKIDTFITLFGLEVTFSFYY